MSTRADQTIAALRTGHDQLAELVRGLSVNDLTRPSGASEWQLAQVLSHLGSGAEINLAALEAALAAKAAPDGDFNKSVWARWDAMTPTEQAEGFLRANQKLVERYEALDPAARENLRIDLGFLPEPVDVATATGFRLTEFALHQWDVEVAFNPYAAVSSEAAPLLTDRVAGLIGWVGKPEALAGRPGTLAVRLAGPEQSFGLRFGDTIEVVESLEQPDGVLTIPAEAWLRLATGRLAPANTPDTVAITGPISLDDLRRAFPGY